MKLQDSGRTLISQLASTRELPALPGESRGHQPGGPCGQLRGEPCPLIPGGWNVDTGLLSEPAY